MSNSELALINGESRGINPIKSSRLDDSLFSKDLAPHYMKLAGQLASSEIVPKCYRNKPSDLFLCWAKGYQLGIPPEQAMDCISVINGKAAMWGDEMLALCMSHPDFQDITEVPITSSNGIIIGYICTIKRKGRTSTVSEFTLDMAKKAGLLAKGGVWNQYPERMLKLRARGFALRDAFPDALKGIKSREEVEDYGDYEYVTKNDKTSRTQELKKQLTVNKEFHDVKILYGCAAPVENQENRQETTQSKEPQEMDEIGETSIEPRAYLKQLLLEKEFTEERLSKALHYYEVTDINELSDEAVENFINRIK